MLREQIAERIWRSEYRRATGKERLIDWAEVNDGEVLKYLYVADAILQLPGILDPAQAASNCGDGFLPVEEWPKEIDERVLLYVVHQNAQYEQDEAKRKAEWEGWFTGYWTDHNGGGWVWHGMLGKVTHAAALLPAPASPLPSTTRGGEA